jgi:hypothetical protein
MKQTFWVSSVKIGLPFVICVSTAGTSLCGAQSDELLPHNGGE